MARNQWPKAETDLAAAFVAWVSHHGWEVYQEVQIGGDGPRADIVGERDGTLWVIETKLTLSLDLLSQAIHWTTRADYVTCGVPQYKSLGGASKRRAAVEAITHRFGIGLTYADYVPDRSMRWKRRGLEEIDEYVMMHDIAPVRALTRKDSLAKALRPEHKTAAAAGSQGGYHTPFRKTALAMSAYVARTPGCTIKDVLSVIGHHYSSVHTARSSLTVWAKEGKIPGVRVETTKAGNKFYPTDQ